MIFYFIKDFYKHFKTYIILFNLHWYLIVLNNNHFLEICQKFYHSICLLLIFSAEWNYWILFMNLLFSPFNQKYLLFLLIWIICFIFNFNDIYCLKSFIHFNFDNYLNFISQIKLNSYSKFHFIQMYFRKS